MSEPFFTIGHSNRTIVEFLDLLGACDVRLVVDVRRLPGSTRCPQFDSDALAGSSPITSSLTARTCATSSASTTSTRRS